MKYIKKGIQDIKVTVIVTVHNAEKYLRECLESVVSQTLKDIEILCIDGGSTDHSPEILQEYADRDSRIRIINDKNTSYGHKVNEGIRQAEGEYISVLESDDMYQADMLKKLYGIVEKYKPDYVNADYFNFYDINEKRYQALVKMYDNEDYGKLLKSEDSLKNMKQILRYWTGIFRKDFLIRNEIRMNESPGASFQDMSFRFLTSALAETAYHMEIPVYLYRIDNPGSSVYDAKKSVVIADEFDFLKKELINRKIEDSRIWRHYYTWKYNDFHGNLIRFGSAERKVLFERCYKELEKDRTALKEIDEQLYSEVITALLTKTEEEMWDRIDEIYNMNQKRIAWFRDSVWNLAENGIVVFGCGMYGRSVLDYLKAMGMEKEIYCLADNAEELWNSKLENYSILPPEQAVSRFSRACYIVAVKYARDEICRQLREYGIDEPQISIFQ
jgi:Glycosyltransferases involved in cell wall biogenesis